VKLKVLKFHIYPTPNHILPAKLLARSALPFGRVGQAFYIPVNPDVYFSSSFSM
jgi:hypothetical protein